MPGAPKSSLGSLISLFWNYLELEEIRFLLKKTINSLLAIYTQTNKGLDYEAQRMALVLVNSLCLHPKTRKTYLEHKFFKKHWFEYKIRILHMSNIEIRNFHCSLALFMYLKPPEYLFMQELIPDTLAWTEGKT